MAEDYQRNIDAVGRVTAVPAILDVVCRITGLGFAAVARVTEDRWIACSVKDDINFGLKPGGELKIETTICNEIRQSGQGVVIDHVALDPKFRDHHTPAMYGFQSYISMPITLSDGSFFGTLCAIDPRPARVQSPEIVSMFKLFAELIAFHLQADEKLATSEASLATSQANLAESEASLRGERADAVLREQFIAVLGHDLRNPLGAIDAGVRLLEKRAGDRETLAIAGMIHASVSRMAGLITNVLDFARGRLGEGIILRRTPDAPIGAALGQVVDELRAANPGRVIETRFDLRESCNCDAPRIAQLFSNLLGNALTHGASDRPVRIDARIADGLFELSVANEGPAISAATMEKLFQPFARGEAGPSGQGLGLGLYIAQEIARAHGGELTAASTDMETRFTLRAPSR